MFTKVNLLTYVTAMTQRMRKELDPFLTFGQHQTVGFGLKPSQGPVTDFVHKCLLLSVLFTLLR